MLAFAMQFMQIIVWSIDVIDLDWSDNYLTFFISNDDLTLSAAIRTVFVATILALTSQRQNKSKSLKMLISLYIEILHIQFMQISRY